MANKKETMESTGTISPSTTSAISPSTIASTATTARMISARFGTS